MVKKDSTHKKSGERNDRKASSTYSLAKEKKELITRIARQKAINLNQLIDNFLTANFYDEMANEGLIKQPKHEIVGTFLETNFPDYLGKQ